jgi:hypothetical protein
MYLFTDPVAYANVNDLLKKINKVIINPIIIFVFTIALVYFFAGVVKFLSSGEDASAKNEGKNHMLWGVIGMFIMVATFAIMNIIINTFHIEGINVEQGTVNIPQ